MSVSTNRNCHNGRNAAINYDEYTPIIVDGSITAIDVVIISLEDGMRLAVEVGVGVSRND